MGESKPSDLLLREATCFGFIRHLFLFKNFFHITCYPLLTPIILSRDVEKKFITVSRRLLKEFIKVCGESLDVIMNMV